jgi:hypothetical protein
LKAPSSREKAQKAQKRKRVGFQTSVSRMMSHGSMISFIAIVFSFFAFLRFFAA